MSGNESLLEGTMNKKSVVTHLKAYLTLIGQWSPSQSRIKRKIYRLWQFLICLGMATFFVYTLGIFGAKKKQFKEYFYFFPISTIEEAVWEFRWLFTGVIGITMSDTCREFFLENSNVTLKAGSWKKVREFIMLLEGVLFLMWALSVVCSLSQLNFDIVACDNGRGCLLDAALLFLDRFFAFPLFLVFCAIVYTLGTMVEEYRERIDNWKSGSPPLEDSVDEEDVIDDLQKTKQGEDGARNEFLKIKTCIRSVGLSFQLYLAVHFLLLFSTFFLGICSCFEQLEVRISENVTMVSPYRIPRYARSLILDSSSASSTGIMAARFLQVNQAETRQSPNASLQHVDDLVRIEWLKKDIHMIITDMVIKTMESLLLYLFPLWLMSRLELQLRRVVETIEDSDCSRKCENYLFSDISKIKSMCKYVKTASGLKVYDYYVPALGAFILAAFGPFVAVVIHNLLSHIHMKR